jgi:capsular polysaccharide biosynthesis protein
MWTIVLVAAVITVSTLGFSLYQTPTYEASVMILVGQKTPGNAKPGPDVTDNLELALTVAKMVDTGPVAEGVVKQLDLPEGSTREVLNNISVEPEPGTMVVNVSYRDSDPKRAQLIANTIGQVLSEKVSRVSLVANGITATVWEPATLPKTPVSPDPIRNSILALVLGGLLGVVLAFLLPVSPSGAASSIGESARQMMRGVGRPASGARRTPATIPPVTEGAKEKELLEALRRHGELTVVGVALETSLSIEEADQMLLGLAAKGYLKVRAKDGGLFYSLWERDALL